MWSIYLRKEPACTAEECKEADAEPCFSPDQRRVSISNSKTGTLAACPALGHPTQQPQQPHNKQLKQYRHNFDVNMVLITRKLFDYIKDGQFSLAQAAIVVVGRHNIRSIRFNNCLSPVHVAALYGHVDILKYLVDEMQLDVGVVDISGRTALEWARLCNHDEAVQFLSSRSKQGAARENLSISDRSLSEPGITENIMPMYAEALEISPTFRNEGSSVGVLVPYDVESCSLPSPGPPAPAKTGRTVKSLSDKAPVNGSLGFCICECSTELVPLLVNSENGANHLTSLDPSIVSQSVSTAGPTSDQALGRAPHQSLSGEEGVAPEQEFQFPDIFKPKSPAGALMNPPCTSKARHTSSRRGSSLHNKPKVSVTKKIGKLLDVFR
jgi:hypothetical protein